MLARYLTVQLGQRDVIGSLWARSRKAIIVATNVNVAALRTSGIDIGFGYVHKLAQLGSIGVNLNAAHC